MSEIRVLIVEDGDEYLESLTRFVRGPTYMQAHNGQDALRLLEAARVDIVYLDMRFDRIPDAELMGDHVAATREHNGDPVRALKHLQNNQGLYILDALERSGLGGVPVILAYDFSRQHKRYENLLRRHPTLRWVPDAVTPTEILSLMEDLLATSRRPAPSAGGE
jgi:CheY-like chemotaxis protein